MKKRIALMLACMLLFALAACGNDETTSNADTPTSQPQEIEHLPETTEAVREKPDDSENTTPEQEKGSAMNALIVYYSWSGNTRRVAEEIRGQTYADIFELVPAEPYTDDYNTLLDIAQKEQRDNARPAFSGSIDGFADYDVIYIGYPNWWSDMPMILYSFFDVYDLSGKTIAPFCTSGGSGLSDTIAAIKSMEPSATVLDGLHVRDSGAKNPGKAITNWLNGLNFEQQ
jgi:flavodoxin